MVTGIVKSDTSNLWAIRAGDVVKDTLKTMYRGRQRPGYYPKLLEGSIIYHFPRCGGARPFGNGPWTRKLSDSSFKNRKNIGLKKGLP